MDESQIPIPEEHTKIFVEWVNTQTIYRRTLFEAKTILTSHKEISEIVAVLLETPNFPDDCYYIDCFDEQLRLDVISAVMKRNSKQKFVSEKLDVHGKNMGINVFITLEGENPLPKPQGKRNKLNRKRSALKKEL